MMQGKEGKWTCWCSSFLIGTGLLGTLPSRHVQAAELVQSKDGSGVVGYKDTPILPWCGFHVHDPDRPLPPRVKPGQKGFEGAEAPEDAMVLLRDGNLNAWQPSAWKSIDGVVEATVGDLKTKEAFGSCQLHLEFRVPDPPRGNQMDRGNSGVFFMSLYELQIFDSYTETIYPDGQCAAVYGETPPLVNACREPGQWQTYDVVFLAPVFEKEKIKTPAYITVFHNGILVHHNTEIHGPCSFRSIQPYKAHPDKLPLALQAHGNPVQFRNIWLRPLD